jgi:hypothetical protein
MSVRVWQTLFFTSSKMLILVSRSPAALYLSTKPKIGFRKKTTWGVIGSSSKKSVPLEYLILRHPFIGCIVGGPKGGSWDGGWAMVLVVHILIN